MNNFEYAIPESVDKALEYLEAKNARLKAGGIDLLDQMKEGLISPKRLVNIREMVDLKFIKKAENGDIHIGPGMTLTELAESKELSGGFQLLAQAAGAVASPQVRNAATIGGNICQRPRCWYFRSADFHCARKGGDTCFALDGENQYHAILGNSDGCAIVHPSGSAVALSALDARIVINKGDSEKTVKIADFFISPAEDIERENILKSNELITAIIIPAMMKNYMSYYIKHKEKHTFDWPLADVAVCLQVEGGICKDARIILGAAAPVPWRSTEAEDELINNRLSKDSARKAAEMAIAKAEPLSLNAYKVPIFKTIVYRTICRAIGIDPIG
jgi:xanthine dehydrogenase YagS FAD-binding subunit